MLTHFEYKLPIVLLSAALLLVLLAWIQAEKSNTWAIRELFKEPRIKSRFPKTSTLRKILLELFNLNHNA